MSVFLRLVVTVFQTKSTNTNYLRLTEVALFDLQTIRLIVPFTSSDIIIFTGCRRMGLKCYRLLVYWIQSGTDLFPPTLDRPYYLPTECFSVWWWTRGKVFRRLRTMDIRR